MDTNLGILPEYRQNKLCTPTSENCPDRHKSNYAHLLLNTAWHTVTHKPSYVHQPRITAWYTGYAHLPVNTNKVSFFAHQPVACVHSTQQVCVLHIFSYNGIEFIYRPEIISLRERLISHPIYFDLGMGRLSAHLFLYTPCQPQSI